MLIVTLSRFATDGELHVHEIETEHRSTFDRIVDSVFRSRITHAAYLVGSDGRMLDSYIKDVRG